MIHRTFLSRFRCLHRSSLGQNNVQEGREGGREGQKTLIPVEPSCGALVGRYHHTFLSRFRCLRRSSLGQNNVQEEREGGRDRRPLFL